MYVKMGIQAQARSVQNPERTTSAGAQEKTPHELEMKNKP
jgi:hypothetical protein